MARLVRNLARFVEEEAGDDDVRAHVASVIAADPGTYSELILGRPNAAYCAWIQNTFNWGGENEILILAR